MSRAAPTLALLALLLAAASPAAASERKSRARVSANGLYSATLVELAPGRCRLELARESGTAWTLERCVGGVDDLFFPANDGRSVWVLYPLPGKGTKRAGRTPAWANAVVARRLDARGTVLAEKRLAELVRRLSEVRQMKDHFKWLAGLLGVPGTAPATSDAGHVELETVDGARHRLTF